MDTATIDHAAKGYANAQETIRFIDQKNAFVSGLSTAIAGVTLAILTKLVGRADEQFVAPLMSPHCGHILGLALLVVSVGLAAACLIYAVLSVRASQPRLDRRVEHSVLFPYVIEPHKEANIQLAFDHYTKKLLDGMDEKSILREYADQLAIVGWILSMKREYHRISVQLFAWQTSTLMLGVIVALVTTDWKSLFSV